MDARKRTLALRPEERMMQELLEHSGTVIFFMVITLVLVCLNNQNISQGLSQSFTETVLQFSKTKNQTKLVENKHKSHL